MISSTLFASDKLDWETPQWLFDKLDAEFSFHLDACASAENAKCRMFWTKEIDGLKQSWDLWHDGSAVWCNPPYGREIKDWVKKCYEEGVECVPVVMLIPARTDTRYWHDYIMKASEIRFIKGRLKFVGAPSAAPFPSVVVVWRPGRTGPPIVSAIEREA